MIRSFADSHTERVWRRRRTKLHPDIQRRLEQLRGKRAGQHSIRINQQWRVCFRWTEAGPADVQTTDYH